MPQTLSARVPDGLPVPMLIIHGTEDRIVPSDAFSVFAGAKYRVLPIEETIAYWVRRNRSEAEAIRSELPDLDPDDGTRAVLFRHAAQSGGAETRYYQVLGGGHTWPGGTERAPGLVVGKTSRDFSASEAIWSFFSRYHMDGVLVDRVLTQSFQNERQ
jgi:polyhydroxybutyrate depolymerase